MYVPRLKSVRCHDRANPRSAVAEKLWEAELQAIEATLLTFLCLIQYVIIRQLHVSPTYDYQGNDYLFSYDVLMSYVLRWSTLIAMLHLCQVEAQS